MRISVREPLHATLVPNCDRLPGALDPIYVERMQSAFMLGFVPPVGKVHQNAIGYATIDSATAGSTSRISPRTSRNTSVTTTC